MAVGCPELRSSYPRLQFQTIDQEHDMNRAYDHGTGGPNHLTVCCDSCYCNQANPLNKLWRALAESDTLNLAGSVLYVSV